MNKEKLINIILKDIEELKDISEEIKKDGSSSILETDIALSKTTIILQEFQLLKEKYTIKEFSLLEPEEEHRVPESNSKAIKLSENISPVAPEVLNKQKEQEITAIKEEQLPEAEEEKAHFEEKKKVIDDSQETTNQKQPTITESEDKIEEEVEDKIEVEEEEEVEEEVEDKIETEVQQDIVERFALIEDEEDIEEDEIKVKAKVKDEDEEIEDDFEDDFEDEEIIPAKIEKHTVGENYHSELSLNDRMTNRNTLDQQIAHSPISNLQSAIGINDRFLFMREMFNNDSALYASVIKRIDNCKDIHEAVDFLSSNFKIKKTETSLKFSELLKRRFSK